MSMSIGEIGYRAGLAAVAATIQSATDSERQFIRQTAEAIIEKARQRGM